MDLAKKYKTPLYVIDEVTLTKKLQADVADTNAVHGESNLVTHPQGEIAKVLQKYVSANKNNN